MRHLIIATLFAVVAPVAAQAATVETRSVRVADLDLNRPAGIAELDRRIDRAARQLCGVGSIGPVWQRRAADECRAEAVARATGDRQAALATRQSALVGR
ncbi:UrcA family protein [Polymorphobacter fuscus]|nr:UrcA family protein [Polymorphobacter fuscus]NJC08670.1 UrcA family protein [Polymorphobacter fuscus]